MSSLSKTLLNVWAVARWEATMARRTVRYWVFGLIAVLAALVIANYYAAVTYLTARFVAVSGTVALLNPKFLVNAYSTFLAVAVALLTTFLAFDFRQKERLARLDLVLGARPIKTGELVAGKVLGVFAPVYAVALFALAAVAISNAIWGFGNHWGAMAATAFLQFPVAVLTLTAITVVVGVLVRSRAVTAILTLVVLLLLLLNVFGAFGTSVTWVPLLDIFGISGVPLPSEMMGLTPMLMAVLHRVGFFLVGIGLLGVATLLYPRPRATAFPWAALGTAVVGLLAGGYLASLIVQDALGTQRLNHQELAEQKALVGAPRIAVTHYDLRVKLDMPAGRLEGVATMDVRNAGADPADRLVFTLNRGLAVRAAKDQVGRDLPFERGLSTIVVTPERALAPGDRLALTIEYGGPFDINAGFLDASIQLLELSSREAQIALLGFQTAYLTDRGAVLFPETRWYPAPNVDYGYGPQGRPPNFATGSLSIDVPEGMVPVTQGTPAAPTVSDSRATTTFDCDTAVPGFSLNVAPFRVVEARVGDLPVALYFHPLHEKNVRFFEDAAPRIEKELRTVLDRAKEEAGLGYPFERLALVECPVGLRGYGGGWEMASPLTQPGVVMLKENPLFELPLESVYNGRVKRMKSRNEDVEPAELKWTLLDELFRYDFSGGNLLDLLSAQFWRERIRAEGPLAGVLNRALGDEASRLAAGRRGYFNPYIYSGTDFNQRIGATLQRAGQQAQGQAPFDFTDTLVASLTDAEDVWQLIESRPLAELEPGDKPGLYLLAVDLKAGAFIQSLRERLGARDFARLLSELAERYSPGTFTLDELRALASEIHGSDLGGFFQMWLESTRLPGFRIVSSEAYRVKTDSGLPRYQALLRLQNGEDVSGAVRVALLVEKEAANARKWDSVERFMVFDGRQEKELAMLVSRRPRRFVVHPYLSLNRGDVSRDLEASEKERDVEPEEGVRDVDFTGEAPGVTIVDDMDAGFRVAGGTSRGALRVGSRKEEEHEGVIPACRPTTQSPTWCRQAIDRAYGRYRHVVTARPSGHGDGHAIWSGEITQGGTCQVDAYLPVLEQSFAWNAMGFRQQPKGKLTYVVEHAGGEETATLSVEGLANGWNGLGEFRFEAGRTYEVRLSDASDGLVVADAIRWTCRP